MTQAQDRRETLARVAAMLARRAPDGSVIDDAITLCALSRSLSRIAERACNEDRGCRECDSTGKREEGSRFLRFHRKRRREDVAHETGIACPEPERVKCPDCAGTGSMDGKRERRLEAKAQAIANHYGLRCYFQGDCRGAALYLIDAERWPLASEDDCHYSQRGTAAY